MDGYDEFDEIENEFLGIDQNIKPKVLGENKNYPLDNYEMEIDHSTHLNSSIQPTISTSIKTIYSAVKTPRSSNKSGSMVKNLLEYRGKKYKKGVICSPINTSIITENPKDKKSYMIGDDKIAETIAADYDYYENIFDYVYKTEQKDDIICGQIITSIDENCKVSDKSASLCTQDDIIPLDFDDMSKVSLFSGKRVVYRGTKGIRKFKVTEDLGLPPIENAKYNEPKNVEAKNFIVHVSAGPFSLPESCDFSPLYSIIDISIKDNVSVLILIGPFIKERQFYDKDIDHETYLAELFNQIYNHISESHLKIIIIPNVESDVCVFPVYPTPRLDLNDELISKISSKIIFLADPSTFTINGVKFSVTGIDCLLHISKSDYYRSEISENENRLDRLTSYIFEQKNFYPIYPPLNGLPYIQTPDSFEMIKIKEIPHILLLSSLLPQSYRNISGCLCVNSGKLLRNGFGKLTFNLTDAKLGATNVLDYVKGEFFELNPFVV
ncbi:DNA polymerase alpha subunit B [Strongyloides ratti]|uniref:DNA polymerase alpha subunit B n=1 Tax=Strongyloides ratti TaxID=34506 RepID=A0A090MXG5_STRRB|nr:DNA polymerase alpha subunit B [Strongyloides ratti]CEF65394.1 DNA polymerase alpha subunit B [Strongyloides ratti]